MSVFIVVTMVSFFGPSESDIVSSLALLLPGVLVHVLM